MKGPQRDPRARLVDALNGAKTHGVTGRHENIFALERAPPEGATWLVRKWRALVAQVRWITRSYMRVGTRDA